MSDYLPHDLLVKILLRVPVNDLLRCTSVCKSWYSIITSPIFITTQFSQPTIPSPSLIFLTQYSPQHDKDFYSLCTADKNFEVYQSLDCPIKYRLREIGSCNGLVYLSELDSGILWNPSIRKFLKLPKPSIKLKTHGIYRLVLGFGFDAKSNDYKVIRIVYLQGPWNEADWPNCTITHPPDIELYSLNSRSWRGISGFPSPFHRLGGYYWSQAFTNGSVHWVAYDLKYKDCYPFVLSFHMGDEVFREIKLPPELVVNIVLDLPIAVFEGCLSVFQYYEDRFSVWVMKEYGVLKSWTKLYTFDINGPVEKTLGLGITNKLALALRGKELISYHPDIEEEEEGTFDADNYRESLVLLKEGDAVPRTKIAPVKEKRSKVRRGKAMGRASGGRGVEQVSQSEPSNVGGKGTGRGIGRGGRRNRGRGGGGREGRSSEIG